MVRKDFLGFISRPEVVAWPCPLQRDFNLDQGFPHTTSWIFRKYTLYRVFYGKGLVEKLGSEKKGKPYLCNQQ